MDQRISDQSLRPRGERPPFDSILERGCIVERDSSGVLHMKIRLTATRVGMFSSDLTLLPSRSIAGSHWYVTVCHRKNGDSVYTHDRPHCRHPIESFANH